jgi:DNA-binding MarR family transcriptional regulator
MAVLISVEEADFNFIKSKINATDGNLSVHIRKLEDNGYVTCVKTFAERKPHSIFKLTDKGKEAFEKYIKQLEKMIKGVDGS